VSQYAPVPAGAVRIGDAERDEAVSVLAEHFVAGRLTQPEFEERSDLATRARYAGDLVPLFTDLPDPAAGPVPRAWSPGFRPRGSRPAAFAWFAPVLAIVLLLTAVILTAPWILWVLFWIALFSGPWHRRRHHHGRYQGRWR